MRLPEFISENEEAILQNFEDFARNHTVAGRSMDAAALRDHGAALLAGIVLDLD